MQLNIKSETGRLREVILGLPYSNGPVPTLDETFDSKMVQLMLSVLVQHLDAIYAEFMAEVWAKNE